MGANGMEIVHGGIVPAKQEMVAVVYEAFQCSFEQGAASSAGMVCGFIKRGPVSGLGQPYGGCHTGKASADDMNATLFSAMGCYGHESGGHGIKKNRSAGQSRAFLVLARAPAHRAFPTLF